jgi:hypothetical protein
MRKQDLFVTLRSKGGAVTRRDVDECFKAIEFNV